MSTISDSIAQAWRHHQAGNLEEAERRYRQILKLAPTHPDVWYLLGVACHVRGDLPEAVRCYTEALRFKPNYPEVLGNLGVAYKLQGKVAEAIASYRRSPAPQAVFP